MQMTSRYGFGGRVAALLVMTALLSGCGINNIPTYDEQVKAAWSQVENQYQPSRASPSRSRRPWWR
jgi:LemA protein